MWTIPFININIHIISLKKRNICDKCPTLNELKRGSELPKSQGKEDN